MFIVAASANSFFLYPSKTKYTYNCVTRMLCFFFPFISLQAKLKVFPVRKMTDQTEHVKMTNTDQSDSPDDSRETSPVPAPKKRVGWGKIMGKT